LKKSWFFLTALFVFTAFFLFSQETEPVDQDQAELETPETSELIPLHDDETLFVISGFEFDITGRTRPFALLYHAELKIGEVIHGQAELDEFIADKTQMLINQRVLRDNVIITYSVGEQRENGAYPVILTIKVEDSRNIIALPQPRYSSNSGLNLTVKARDYNFLGTMRPLRLDVGYSYDEEGRNFFNLMLDTDTPFRLFNLDWNFNFDHSFTYRPNLSEPYYYNNITGISVEIPFKRTTITTGFNESFVVNPEISRIYWDKYGRFQKGLYMSSNPYINWIIPTGFHYYHLGEVYYVTSVSSTFNHEFPPWPLFYFLKGPWLSFSHGFTFGRVDWVDNFRKGVSASISNGFSYDFYDSPEDLTPLSASLNLSASGFKIIGKRSSFSTRLLYRHWFFDDYTISGGDVVRGIPDNDIVANYMFSLNLELTYKLFKFMPSSWFKNEKWRLFDFDFHVTPFVDMALYNNPITQEPFGFENMLLGAGLEVIVFPLRFRSLFLRASAALGVETGRLGKGFSKELYIGTDLHL
jgi:hypothetical protein